MSARKNHSPLPAICAILLIGAMIGAADSPAQPLMGRDGLKKAAERNRKLGDVLFAQNCAHCHVASDSITLPAGAKPSEAIDARREDWAPGPLELWRAIHKGPPEMAVSGHTFSHLGEENIWRIIQSMRQRAGLLTTHDPPEIRKLVLAIQSQDACYAPIKEEIEQITTEMNASRRAMGQATYASQCASCHGADGLGTSEHPRATKFADSKTIWRRRTAPLDIFNSISAEGGVREHAEIALPLEEQWALVLWMRADLIPAEKLREQPEIPMRGHVDKHCKIASEEVTPVGAEPARFEDAEAWRKSLTSPTPDMRDPAQLEVAKNLYTRHCGNCHGDDGAGEPGQFPPLAESTWMKAASDEDLIDVLLLGMSGEVEVNGKTYNGFMAGYGEKLDDAQLAAIASYVDVTFGEGKATFGATDVAARRGAKGLPPKPSGPAALAPGISRRTGALAARPCAMCHGDTIPAGDKPATILSTILLPNDAAPHPLLGQSMTLHQLTGLLVHADPKHRHLTPQDTIALILGL